MPRAARPTRPFDSIVALTFATAALIPLPNLAAQGAATAGPGKSPVPPSEFTKWETPAAADLSPDGKWIAYEIRRVNGNNELH